MTYLDDILNVNAFLKSKMAKNIQDVQAMLEDYKALDASYDEMLQQSDLLVQRVKEMAAQLGIAIPEPPPAVPPEPPEEAMTCARLLVELPHDYDFGAAFSALAKEAHAAGFVDVHPEELLTTEELQHAAAFSDELDNRFARQTGLTSKDMGLLMKAIALRVISWFLFLRPIPSSEVQLSAPVISQEPKSLDQDIDAMSGVNLDSLLKNADTLINSITQGEKVVRRFTGKKFHDPVIKTEPRIIQDPIPFDLADNQYFVHDNILGFHPMLGWLFGVMNIMTDTVTTDKLTSFSIRSGMGSVRPQVDHRVSTIIHLMLPILRNFSNSKESFLAAIVREAQVLGVTKAPAREVSSLMRHIMETEEKNQSIINGIQTLADINGINLMNLAADFVHIAFLNQIITAMHAVSYQPETDGDIQMYTIRTNKILYLSTVIAAGVNSMPGLLAGNWEQMDFAGIIAACLSLFNSTRFWIEVKTNYLVSAYKQEIDGAFASIDNYFKIV